MNIVCDHTDSSMRAGLEAGNVAVGIKEWCWVSRVRNSHWGLNFVLHKWESVKALWKQ